MRRGCGRARAVSRQVVAKPQGVRPIEFSSEAPEFTGVSKRDDKGVSFRHLAPQILRI